MTANWKKIMVIAASGVTFICTFLPWVSVRFYGASVSGNLLDASEVGFLGLIVALAGIGGGVTDLILSRKQSRLASGITSISAGAIVIILALTIYLGETMRSAMSLGAGSIGFGGIIAIIGALAMIAGGILCLLDKVSDKTGPIGGMHGNMNNMNGMNTGMENGMNGMNTGMENGMNGMNTGMENGMNGMNGNMNNMGNMGNMNNMNTGMENGMNNMNGMNGNMNNMGNMGNMNNNMNTGMENGMNGGMNNMGNNMNNGNMNNMGNNMNNGNMNGNMNNMNGGMNNMGQNN